MAMLEKLARCIGPIDLMRDEGGPQDEELHDAPCAAASQADDSLDVTAMSVGPPGPLPESQHHTVPLMEITHNVHKLHFLIDNVQAEFWDTCIVVDVDHNVPAASIVYGTGVPCSTISMRMSWQNLRGLFGLPPR
jgi:hypothetical protein